MLTSESNILLFGAGFCIVGDYPVISVLINCYHPPPSSTTFTSLVAYVEEGWQWTWEGDGHQMCSSITGAISICMYITYRTHTFFDYLINYINITKFKFKFYGLYTYVSRQRIFHHSFLYFYRLHFFIFYLENLVFNAFVYGWMNFSFRHIKHYSYLLLLF